MDGCYGIVGLRGPLELREKALFKLIARGAGTDELDTQLRAPNRQATGYVVGVAYPGQFSPFESPEVFAHGEEVSNGLARMRMVREPIDDTARGVVGDAGDGLMLLGSNDDDIDHAAKNPGEVGHALAVLAEAGVLTQHDAAAAQVGHAGLEADAGTERLLLKQETPSFDREAEASRTPCCELGSSGPRRSPEYRFDFRRLERSLKRD